MSWMLGDQVQRGLHIFYKVLFWVIKLAALITDTLEGTEPARMGLRDVKYFAKFVLLTLEGKLVRTGTRTNDNSLRTCLLS
jgi:hypothetical protein